MKFEEKIQEYRQYIEAFLAKISVCPESEPQITLFDAMGYSLLAGGKRLRSVLTFAFCELTGGDYRQAVPFAAAVEMIHTYSLIHDDLPCMDDDDLRRGKPTNHKVFGEATAVLAGDALLTDAFGLAASAELGDERNVIRGIRILSTCAGSLGMVGGQVLDMMSEERLLTEEEVLAIQNRKTGALIRCACQLGVLAGGGTEKQLQAAGRFADALGLAFQIRDDMLDVIGTREEMGKGVGTDEKKNTFVRLYGLDRCGRMVDTYTEEAIRALDEFEDPAFLTALAENLTQRRT